LTADGSGVVFSSSAGNLDVDDFNQASDVFFRERLP
jgi:hypothetical protein